MGAVDYFPLEQSAWIQRLTAACTIAFTSGATTSVLALRHASNAVFSAEQAEEQA
jgi:hypothetical protein